MRLEDAVRSARCYRDSGLVIAATNGCFDLLHIGHVQLFRYCKGNDYRPRIVFVGLNDDESVRLLKGNNRPLNSVLLRQQLLEELRSVDHVVPFSGRTACEFLDAVKPDIWVKGADYTPARLDQDEVALVLRNGGRIEFAPLQPISTSELIRKCQT